jgi:hypothetical protein
MKAMLVWSPGSRRSSARAPRRLGRRGALAGQRRLVDLQRARRDDAPVRRHLVPGGDQDDVADDELLGRDLRLLAAAPHPRGRLHHRLQGVHRALGLALLAQADDRVQQRQQDQQHRRAPLLDRQRHDGGGDQDDLHIAAVLVEEAPPRGRPLLLGQRVRAVRVQKRGRLIRGQPDRRIDA